MRIVRRNQDTVVVNRTVMLSSSLSLTSRLLYATLLASLDTGVSTAEVAALAGLGGAPDMEPYIEELKRVGVVDVVYEEDGSPTLLLHTDLPPNKPGPPSESARTGEACPG